MKHIGEHIKMKSVTVAKKRATERGELMEYFCGQINSSRIRDGFGPINMGRMGRILQSIPTKDLYYLQSVCTQAKDFSKKFWWEVSPERHFGKETSVQSGFRKKGPRVGKAGLDETTSGGF